MNQYKEVTEVVSIPAGIGIEGFVKVLRDILKKGRVQRVVIEMPGQITSTRFAQVGELSAGPPVETYFDDVSPYNVIRNAEMFEESSFPSALNSLARLFQRVLTDNLQALAFVASPNTTLWDWYEKEDGLKRFSKSSLLGLPVFYDRHMEDPKLVLCAGYSRAGTLVDTVRAYTILIPMEPK